MTMTLVFAPAVVARLREKESPIKEKETREEGDRTVADHPGQKEVSAPEALRPCVEGSRPFKTTQRRVVSSCGGSG